MSTGLYTIYHIRVSYLKRIGYCWICERYFRLSINEDQMFEYHKEFNYVCLRRYKSDDPHIPDIISKIRELATTALIVKGCSLLKHLEDLDLKEILAE